MLEVVETTLRNGATAYRYRCTRCQRRTGWTHDPPQRVHHACLGDPPPPPLPAIDNGVVVQPEPTSGPGTELKKLLRLVGIYPTANCNCNRHAAYMDTMGPEWCAENVETIVGWLRDAAAIRNLPFSELIARRLVLYAIRRARKR